MENYNSTISRRRFLQTGAAAMAFSAAPFINCGALGVKQPMTRDFGRLDFPVTTLGLGGQASLQWTPDNVDPVKIILKAYELGVNYYDTSNLYGPSQSNYGKAFKLLGLAPGEPGYSEAKRRSLFLTSKTALRWGKGGYPVEGVMNWTNGDPASHAVDDLKRTLSLVFGDGAGNYPQGAYLDMILIHALSSMQEVDILYTGLENTDPLAEHIGALAALRDYRDGTNLTGLNPKEEKLVRHIGFSGHWSPAVMMEMIQRDTHNLLEGMLVAINANDRLYFNMQHNVIPVAAAKNMGVIAMKVFADGAMYSKEATWSNKPAHVVHSVGSASLPSRPLVEYSLTTPGVHTAIIGIGHIDQNGKACQLQQNLSAAQIGLNGLTAADRSRVEDMTRVVKEGKTNYFQVPEGKLTAPRETGIKQQFVNNDRVVRLSWHTAYAGAEPLRHYEIWRDNQLVSQVLHYPQISKSPYLFEDKVADRKPHSYKLVSVDTGGNRAETAPLALAAI
ncbi:MAG TPA: aldo/keto reductase [bacterium]|nr:aldo/keto reductase [bacterium]HPN42716.1 aldo/keto reductase [bacterium]